LLTQSGNQGGHGITCIWPHSSQRTGGSTAYFLALVTKATNQGGHRRWPYSCQRISSEVAHPPSSVTQGGNQGGHGCGPDLS